MADKGIEDDILNIRNLQDAYFAQYGKYFETDGPIPRLLPSEGSDNKITRLPRFIGKRDSGHQNNIPFIPTAKDTQIIIGQSIFVNSAQGGYAAHAEKRAYKVTIRRRNGQNIEQTSFCGGDPQVAKDFENS